MRKEVKKMVQIRKGDKKDLNEFFELYWVSAKEHESYHAFDKLRKKEDCRKAILKQMKESMKKHNFIFIVAVNDSKVIGMATGRVGERDEPDVFENDLCGYIEEFCLDPAFRHKGIGALLLVEIERRLSRKGAEAIGLAVAERNQAIDFYNKHGYTTKAHWMIKISGEKDGRKPIQTKITNV